MMTSVLSGVFGQRQNRLCKTERICIFSIEQATESSGKAGNFCVPMNVKIKMYQMRKIILNLAISLDGYTEGPNGELDWLVRDETTNAAGYKSGVTLLKYTAVF